MRNGNDVNFALEEKPFRESAFNSAAYREKIRKKECDDDDDDDEMMIFFLRARLIVVFL